LSSAKSLFPHRSCLVVAIQSVSAKEVGKFAYRFAPENLANSTVKVDGNMVAMSEDIYAQLASNSSDTLVDTPSIFFIIDIQEAW